MSKLSNNQERISVLCVEDNGEVSEALKVMLSREESLVWKGSLPCADQLTECAIRECPDIVLLDLDMPGKDPFEALAQLVERCPDVRVVIFTGHVRRDLVERALDAGAWGYVSKNDGEEELIEAIHQVASGEVALGSEPRRHFDSR